MSKTINPYEDGAIVITLEGGVIQDIEGIPPGVTVRVLDFDTEGVGDGELHIVNDEKQKAVVSEWSARLVPHTEEAPGHSPEARDDANVGVTKQLSSCVTKKKGTK